MQKPPTLIGFAFTAILSAVAGSIPTAILASADNGYIAGYFILPLLILFGIVCVLLLISAILFIAKDKFAIGLYFLLSILLVPAFWLGSASVAKHFEIGAYRIEPMRPIIPPIANKIIFKKGVSSDEVQAFWRDVLSTPHPGGGSMSLPGVQSMSTAMPEDGHEVLLFSFFETATDEQKAAVRDRIVTSSIVLQLQEDTAIGQTDLDLPNNSKIDEAKRKDSKVIVK